MTLSLDEINNLVLTTIADELDVSKDTLTPSTSLVNDLHADSLALTNIVMQLEEKLEIDIPDEAWASIKTIGDIAGQIRAAKGDILNSQHDAAPAVAIAGS